MEISMRNRCLALLALLLPICLSAQTLQYQLPRTTVAVEVDAVQEYRFAGPYAAFAKRLLGLDVPLHDDVVTRVTEVRLQALVEADPDSSYTCPAKAGEKLLALSPQGLVAFASPEESQTLVWRFQTPLKADWKGMGITEGEKKQTYLVYQNQRPHHADSGYVRTPVQQTRKVEKTLEEKAVEAADMILNVRRERLNIATGNTDASFSGEALAAALGELQRIEEEYLPLFTGVTRSRCLRGAFEVTPPASARGARCLAFVVSDREGLLASGDGTPYYLQFIPQVLSAPEEESPLSKAQARIPRLYYLEPAVCLVRLTEDDEPVLETRLPVYQWGTRRSIPLK